MWMKRGLVLVAYSSEVTSSQPPPDDVQQKLPTPVAFERKRHEGGKRRGLHGSADHRDFRGIGGREECRRPDPVARGSPGDPPASRSEMRSAARVPITARCGDGRFADGCVGWRFRGARLASIPSRDKPAPAGSAGSLQRANAGRMPQPGRVGCAAGCAHLSLEAMARARTATCTRLRKESFSRIL